MKIGTKLLLAFLIVSSLIGIVGIISYDISKNMLTDSIGTNSNEIANQMLDKIESRLHANINMFQMFSNEDSFQSHLIKSNEEFAKLENPQQLIDKLDVEWISEPEDSLSPLMSDLINNELSGVFRTHQAFVYEKLGYHYIGEVFVTNAFGANIAQTGRTTDYKQNDEIWWQVAKEQGIHVSPIEFDRSAGIFARDISVRIEDDDGNFLGVIKHVINVQEIFEIIDEVNDMKKFETQHFTLLDENFNIIYSTTPSYDDSYFLSAYPNETILEKINQLSDYFIFSSVSESDKLISYTTNKYDSNSTWTLITDYDVSEILSPVDNLRLIIFSISGITTLFAIIFGMYISRSISKPVSILKDEMIKVEQGNFPKNMLSISNDEIGELTMSFQKMSKELESTIELEKKLAVEKEKVKNERLLAIGELSGRLAHDLRNPLSVIKTTLESMRKKHPDFESGKLDRVERAVDRMNHQIESVMDFVRLRKSELYRYSVSEILELVMDSLAIPVTVKVNLPENDTKILCDKHQCEVLFYNLIFNAIQEIETIGGIISIRIIEKNDFVFLEFEDSGSGLTKENLKNIFDPLFTTKQHGTGLGLASCKNIIEQFGGKITVKINPTIFTLVFNSKNET